MRLFGGNRLIEAARLSRAESELKRQIGQSRQHWRRDRGPLEVHFTLQQIASAWRVDPESVRRVFINEVGVLILGKHDGKTGKRAYLTIRVPGSVLSRVYKRVTQAGSAKTKFQPAITGEKTGKFIERKIEARSEISSVTGRRTTDGFRERAAQIETAGKTSVFVQENFAIGPLDSISRVAEAFLDNCVTNGVRSPTITKYRNTLYQLAQFVESDETCNANDVQKVSDVSVTDLDRFRAMREIAQTTSLKELQTLRQFWNFCAVRNICSTNIAALIKPPRIRDQNSFVPYTSEELRAITDACARFGRNEYERKRARAIVLTLRHTALRIGDIALLRRDRISRCLAGWWIFLRTTKNNASVYLPIPKEMVEAFADVPAPRGSDGSCQCYFWNQKSRPKSVISVVSETLSAVFRASGVYNATAHRFRHSLATRLLESGGSFEEAADVLGNSPEIVKKHYAKWSTKRQVRINELLRSVNGDG